MEKLFLMVALKSTTLHLLSATSWNNLMVTPEAPNESIVPNHLNIALLNVF